MESYIRTCLCAVCDLQRNWSSPLSGDAEGGGTAHRLLEPSALVSAESDLLLCSCRECNFFLLVLSWLVTVFSVA